MSLHNSAQVLRKFIILNVFNIYFYLEHCVSMLLLSHNRIVIGDYKIIITYPQRANSIYLVVTYMSKYSKFIIMFIR